MWQFSQRMWSPMYCPTYLKTKGGGNWEGKERKFVFFYLDKLGSAWVTTFSVLITMLGTSNGTQCFKLFSYGSLSLDSYSKDWVCCVCVYFSLSLSFPALPTTSTTSSKSFGPISGNFQENLSYYLRLHSVLSWKGRDIKKYLKTHSGFLPLNIMFFASKARLPP